MPELSAPHAEDRSRNELQWQRRLLHSVTDNASVALFIMDERQHCVFMNPAAEKLTGFALADVAEKPLHDFVHHTHPDGTPYPLADCPIDRAFPERNQVRGEEVFVHRDGHFYDVEFTASPIRNDAGEPVGTIIEVQDITERKRSQRAMRETEGQLRAAAAQLRLVTDAAPVFLAHWSADARLQFINLPYAKLLGCTPQECLGKSFEELLGDASPMKAPHLQAALRGERAEFEELVPYPSGNRWMHGTYVPQRDAAGRVIGLVAVLQDVTARRDAEDTLRASEERFRAAFENAAVGIAHVALDGRWLRVNDRLREILGYAGDALLSRTFQAITHPDDLQSDLELMHQLLAGKRQSYSIDKRYIRQDGSAVWATLTGSLVRALDGSPAYFIAVIQDITIRKRAEAALQEADRRKDEFLAILAHELRNPLAPIRTAAALLDAQAGSNPAVAPASAVIHRQVTHMTRLLDDLLDVSRLSTGQFELRRAPVPLREILDAAVETAQPLVDQRQQQLTLSGLDASLVLDGDAARLTQVFANLLNNAAVYSDAASEIAVTARRDGDTVEVTVRDQGIGIAADMLDRVFDSFRRGDCAQRRAPRGIGIGLSLARRLVEMHGGMIRAESAGPGLGSTFIVRLPLMNDSKTADVSATTTPGEPRSAARLRVLVVDDNVDAADMMALLLQSAGEVHTAYDGESALREAERITPDLVLLDIGLPDLDGHEVCRKMRAQPWGQSVVIVAVTGWGQDHDRQRSAESGFNRHLVKPADPDEVLEIVRSVNRTGQAR